MLEALEREIRGQIRDIGNRERLLAVVRALEADPSLLGASAHLLACGRARMKDESGKKR